MNLLPHFIWGSRRLPPPRDLVTMKTLPIILLATTTTGAAPLLREGRSIPAEFPD